MKKYFVFLVWGLLMLPAVIFAKEGVDSSETVQTTVLYKKEYIGKSSSFGLNDLKSTSSTSKFKRRFFTGLRFGGWARMYMFHRDMQQYYDIAPDPIHGLTVPVNLSMGDGYQQPLMLLRLEANPSAKTYFQTELQFDHRLLTKPLTR